MSDHYILIGQTPVPCGLMEWARWFEKNDRRVRFTRVLGIVDVSTVFLGFDHSFRELFPDRDLEPILFESMAFWRGEGGYEQERCSTWAEAEAQHAEMVREVARPAAVWAYFRRRARAAWSDARRDWQRAWEEMRGIEPGEFEAALDRMGELRMDWEL
jgi:hypothetical protein